LRPAGIWAVGLAAILGRLAATSILAASVIVLVCGALFFGVLEDVITGDPITNVDQSVYRFMQSVRTPWGDAVLAGLATLGSTGTLAALIATVALWMVWERRWRTIGYWLAAVVFSQMLIFALQFAMQRAAPNGLLPDAYVFPSNHVAATVIVYGFLAFLLARRVGMLEGLLVVTVTTLIVILVALAGVYFGRYWVSDAIGGAALAYMWVAIVALTAMLRHPQPPPTRRWMPAIVLAVVLASVGLQSGLGMMTPPGALAPLPLAQVTRQQWTQTVWKQLPCYRSDMGGDRKEPLTLQWVAHSESLRQQLRRDGWLEGTDLSAHSLLSLASPDVAATALPVLPKLNNGVLSSLVFMRPGATRNERDVLRFWPSGYAVGDGAAGVPLWVGSIAHERLAHASWPLNVVQVDKHVSTYDIGMKLSADSVASVVATGNCHGVPVALLASVAQ